MSRIHVLVIGFVAIVFFVGILHIFMTMGEHLAERKAEYRLDFARETYQLCIEKHTPQECESLKEGLK